VLRGVLLAVFVLSFVAAYLSTSAAFEQTSVSQVAAELLRAPEIILMPGLEGNTASQLLAVYTAAAIVAAVAYALSMKSNDGYGAVMVGLSTFIAGIALILALSLWSEPSAATDWPTWALSAIAGLLWVRWWHVAGRAMSSAGLPPGRVAKVNYWVAGILMAAGPIVLLAAQFSDAAKALLPDVLLFGGPILLVSYLLTEGLRMRATVARAGPRAAQ
jgi:hypothetical protein